MKTIEQKAKAYDEAIERARHMWFGSTDTSLSSTKETVEYIFPEFAESEDDKVRKELYDFCIKCSRGETIVNQRGEFQRWAAWLEKQGEQIVWENVGPVTEDDKLHLIMNEQKPSWSEEDECHFNDVLWCCKQAAKTAKDENDMGTIWYAEKWLKSLKERMKGE